MSNYEKFLLKFSEEFSENSKIEDKIYEFIYKFEDGKNPMEAELKADLDEVENDSYGNEDSTLKHVFYFLEFDVHVQFEGTRQSYNGEEWEEMKQVFPKEQTVTIYTYE